MNFHDSLLLRIFFCIVFISVSFIMNSTIVVRLVSKEREKKSKPNQKESRAKKNKNLRELLRCILKVIIMLKEGTYAYVCYVVLYIYI